MNQYEFCASWITDQISGTGDKIKVLDYGCGYGKIVEKLREKDVEAFGCDIFYGGSDDLKAVNTEFLKTSIIRKMETTIIPFDDNSFNYVINNQVMEHVEDLDSVLSEIYRVLKPGGAVLSLFPHKEIWPEVHCGIPFLHRFPKGHRLRVYYALAFRLLGFGSHKANKDPMSWSVHKCDWIDKWTYYRSLTEIENTYNKYFVEIHHIEDYWLRQRLVGYRNAIANCMPLIAQRLVARKFGGLIFTSCKLLT
jgi:SAM-dependent methyltransferase